LACFNKGREDDFTTKKRGLNPMLRAEKGGWVIDVVVWGLLLTFCFSCLYPFWFIMVASFNEGYDMMLGGVYFWPRKPTINNYLSFFGQSTWMNAMKISVMRTLIGSGVTTIFTCLVSYALSRKNLLFGKTYRRLFVFSMYVSGGLIPFYFVLRLLGLVNTFGVYIIPAVINLFFVMVGMSFFRTIPDALMDAAYIDGASEIRIFFQIILPLSLPFIATLGLFSGVGQWNSWIDSVYYVSNKALRPMAHQMMTLINRTLETSNNTNVGGGGDVSGVIMVTTLTAQATAVVATVTPILVLYPFLQRYFVQGLTVGSVKE
jgi:putative aldouronate transport system permease protein